MFYFPCNLHVFPLDGAFWIHWPLLGAAYYFTFALYSGKLLPSVKMSGSRKRKVDGERWVFFNWTPIDCWYAKRINYQLLLCHKTRQLYQAVKQRKNARLRCDSITSFWLVGVDFWIWGGTVSRRRRTSASASPTVCENKDRKKVMMMMISWRDNWTFGAFK